MSNIRVLLSRLLPPRRRSLRDVFDRANLLDWIRTLFRKISCAVRLVLFSSFKFGLKKHDDRKTFVDAEDKAALPLDADAHNTDVIVSQTITGGHAMHYKTIQDGQIIPPSGAMASSCPFIGGNIRNKSCMSLAPHLSPQETHAMRRTRSANNSCTSLSYPITHRSVGIHRSASGAIMGFDASPWAATDLQCDNRNSALRNQQPSFQKCDATRGEARHDSQRRSFETHEDEGIHDTIDVIPPAEEIGDVDLSMSTNTYLPSWSASDSSGSGGRCSMPDNRRDLVILSRADAIESMRSLTIREKAPSIESSASPVCPTETRRYGTRTRISKEDTDIVMQPLMLQFSEPAFPSGWTKISHPEGARYFYNRGKRVYTDSEIEDPAIIHHLENEIARLTELSTTFAVPFPENAEFVINVYLSDGNFHTEYYCVNHDLRTVFFLHVFHAKWLSAWTELPGIKSKALLRIELEAQYWYFVQLFPTSKKLTDDVICELRDVVLHLIGDIMTSPYSTACYTLDDLLKILGVTYGLKKNCDSMHASGSMCLLARHMYIFMHSRFLNAHGESYARLERDFSLYGDKLHPKTWFIKLLSPLFFSTPHHHLKTLQRMWVDALLHRSAWEKMVAKLTSEWKEFLLSATILLNADIAFLSIHGADDVGNSEFARTSPARIAAYVSTIANLGSIIVSLLLLRSHHMKTVDSAEEVHDRLGKKKHRILGFEPLAIIYSLPYTLLIWGLISLLASLALLCFQNTNTTTRSITGAAGGLLAFLCAWCIISFWESGPTASSDSPRPLAYAFATEQVSNGHSDDFCSENLDANRVSKRRPFEWIRRILWRSSTTGRVNDTENTGPI